VNAWLGKSHAVRRWHLLAAGTALLCIGVILGSLGKTATPEQTMAATAPPVPVATSSAPAALETPVPTIAPLVAPKQWMQVTTLAGNGPKRGAVFALTGAQARLRYTLQGDSTSVLAVYVVEEGHSVQKDGGSPDVNVDKPGTDETMLANPAGRYYLDVNSANGTWTVIVEEYR
jgi:hypothetical protein